jgi:hypothetical protein
LGATRSKSKVLAAIIIGDRILSSEVAHATIYQLTVLLQEIIQLDNVLTSSEVPSLT